MKRHGFVRIAAVSPPLEVAAPEANARAIEAALLGPECDEAEIVLFPELALTGSTCEDLFGQQTLLEAARNQLLRLREVTRERRQLVVVGLPLAVGNNLYNVAAVISDGTILGIVPKQSLPNYGEFYEARRFTAATGSEPEEIELDFEQVPFGIDLLFAACDPSGWRFDIGVELCEDLWVPIPPSSHQALAGATVLLNPSASNELIGKRDYRRGLVASQSARCLAAYVYASSGPGESTTDLVFGGHCLIAENGRILAEEDALRLPEPGESQAAEESGKPTVATADIDVEQLLHDRRRMTTFDDPTSFSRTFRRIEFALSERRATRLARAVSATPFVPQATADLEARCREIFGIQCHGLARRLAAVPDGVPLRIGVSGGLDSTLALLVAAKTCDLIGTPRERIQGLTMPGFGTTERTRTNALALMEHLGVRSETIDIRPLCLEAFRELKHHPFGLDPRGMDLEAFQQALAKAAEREAGDLVFENVQARLRTFLLMSGGFVIGTGDLSEAALGWSTYNGDQMSMYNPNCSIPKTLVRFLVREVARREFDGPARQTLLDIAETPISPELLPTSAGGELLQATEKTLGPYELHDFFLYYALRHGFGPEKIHLLAREATFNQPVSPEDLWTTLKTFYERFFANQFKRSCVPDGPKVGSVSLSPRGDWRMPSDAQATAWLDELG